MKAFSCIIVVRIESQSQDLSLAVAKSHYSLIIHNHYGWLGCSAKGGVPVPLKDEHGTSSKNGKDTPLPAAFLPSLGFGIATFPLGRP